MLITDFCPSPLHWGKNFTPWALSREWLFWDVLKMHHFTQLGFTDNLELKEEDSNRNRLNALLVWRTETINRQTIVWVTWVFFFFFFNTFGQQTLGKRYREDRRYLVPCPATAICYFKTLFETKPFVCCIRRVKYIFHFTRDGCVFCGHSWSVAYRGFNFVHELLWTTRVRQPKDLRRN